MISWLLASWYLILMFIDKKCIQVYTISYTSESGKIESSCNTLSNVHQLCSIGVGSSSMGGVFLFRSVCNVKLWGWHRSSSFLSVSECWCISHSRIHVGISMWLIDPLDLPTHKTLSTHYFLKCSLHSLLSSQHNNMAKYYGALALALALGKWLLVEFDGFIVIRCGDARHYGGDGCEHVVFVCNCK